MRLASVARRGARRASVRATDQGTTSRASLSGWARCRSRRARSVASGGGGAEDGSRRPRSSSRSCRSFVSRLLETLNIRVIVASRDRRGLCAGWAISSLTSVFRENAGFTGHRYARRRVQSSQESGLPLTYDCNEKNAANTHSGYEMSANLAPVRLSLFVRPHTCMRAPGESRASRRKQ